MAPLKSPAKYHRVEASLAGRIREGRYGDDPLPGERDLAAEFQVARSTVRHALQRLEDQGLVRRYERRGTIAVSGLDAARRRRLLREHVDQFLDRGRPDQRKVLRYGRVAASAAVAEALGLQAGATVLRVVRLRSRGGAPLTYTEVFVPERLAHRVDRASLGRKAFIQVLEDSGLKIGAAEQAVRAEVAPSEVAAALGLGLYEPVLKLERTVRDADGALVQLLLGWYRADRFELRMQLSPADDVTRVWIGQR